MGDARVIDLEQARASRIGRHIVASAGPGSVDRMLLCAMDAEIAELEAKRACLRAVLERPSCIGRKALAGDLRETEIDLHALNAQRAKMVGEWRLVAARAVSEELDRE